MNIVIEALKMQMEFDQQKIITLIITPDMCTHIDVVGRGTRDIIIAPEIVE